MVYTKEGDGDGRLLSWVTGEWRWRRTGERFYTEVFLSLFSGEAGACVSQSRFEFRFLRVVVFRRRLGQACMKGECICTLFLVHNTHKQLVTTAQPSWHLNVLVFAAMGGAWNTLTSSFVQHPLAKISATRIVMLTR